MGLLCGSSGEQCVLVYHVISIFHLFLAALIVGFVWYRKFSRSSTDDTRRDEVTAISYLIAAFLVILSISLWLLV